MTKLQRTLALGIAAAVAVFALAFLYGNVSDPWKRAGLPRPGAPFQPAFDVTFESAESMAVVFDAAGYRLAAVRSGKAEVPPFQLRKLPADFSGTENAAERKRLFIRSVLPLVLQVNKHIEKQRAALLRLLRKQQRGEKPTEREADWLKQIALLYRVKPEQTAELRRRIVPIPPALALAQAAAESGWGTSRFALKGNALFGQWTFVEGEGIKPREAKPGSRHAVKSYRRLIGSAWDYARNINSNPAYRELRIARARGADTGLALAAHLQRYSERGMDYVDLLKTIIQQNGLALLNKAKLANDLPD
jgi:Bax protein